MRLVEAIISMEQGDVFKPNDSRYCSTVGVTNIGALIDESKDPIPFSVANMNIEGEIIRAEPEVLTTEEIMNDIANKMPGDQWYPFYVKDVADKCDKNGQIKEWERTKELRDASADAVELINTKLPTGNALEKAIKNLTPP